MAARRRFPGMGSSRHHRRRAMAAGTAALLAGIHLDRVGTAAREAAYLAVLFGVAAIGFGWVAAQLARGDDIDAWVVGAALAAGTTAGYLLSCTVGLPGLSPERWTVLGDSSTVLAAVLLITAVARSRLVVPASHERGSGSAAKPSDS